MQTPIPGPAVKAPGSMKALAALSASAALVGVAPATQFLVHLRASQIIGCGTCARMHGRALKRKGESDARLAAVADWRQAPADRFTDTERAAFALTEAVTRAGDTPDRVPDEVWAEAARHYGERALAALFATITTSDAWHRIHPTTTTARPGTRTAAASGTANAGKGPAGPTAPRPRSEPEPAAAPRWTHPGRRQPHPTPPGTATPANWTRNAPRCCSRCEP
ncbi:carboxymuconolactone decarboxylase family protein [Streptomyces sp. NPDC051211]|uniref:carboxymuconolactone decarboxylase family protein n=1 Tax=Streptomyces sp. NPDC051211 TaxID=3154643 RepID=UPI00344E89AB